MPLFDAFIFVDWSAAGRAHPQARSPNALWVGETSPERVEESETYHRTRQAAVNHIIDRLFHHASLEHRVLVGFDFSFGYPKGFAGALSLRQDGLPWRAIWDEISKRIHDSDQNHNNRFSAAAELNRIVSGGGRGPFWGCPPAQVTEHLGTHSPGFPFPAANGTRLERLRACEQVLPGVQEAWGLYGVGRVGGQTLTGIPRVRRLRFETRLEAFSRVWPFETGFTSRPTPAHGPYILYAEIWPGVVEGRVRQTTLPVRDQAQVRALCQWARHLDALDEFGALFETPPGLEFDQVRVCVQAEGWILGAGHQKKPRASAGTQAAYEQADVGSKTRFS